MQMGRMRRNRNRNRTHIRPKSRFDDGALISFGGAIKIFLCPFSYARAKLAPLASPTGAAVSPPQRVKIRPASKYRQPIKRRGGGKIKTLEIGSRAGVRPRALAAGTSLNGAEEDGRMAGRREPERARSYARR